MNSNPELFKHLLQKKGVMEIPSTGVSMFPLITNGDLCTFVPFDYTIVKKGDILLFLSNTGSLVGHRFSHTLSRRNEVLFICKGDSNYEYDEPIRASQIIGSLSLIKKKQALIRMDGILAILWGNIILHIPYLSRLLRFYLNMKSKKLVE